jgi:hypothetical protein
VRARARACAFALLAGFLLGAASDYSLAEGAFGARQFRAYRPAKEEGGLEFGAYM